MEDLPTAANAMAARVALTPATICSVAAETFDATLQARVAERLRANTYSALRSIQCTVENMVVVLSGRVPSYFLKQVAQSLAARAAPEARIVNRITVTAAYRLPSPYSASETPMLPLPRASSNHWGVDQLEAAPALGAVA